MVGAVRANYACFAGQIRSALREVVMSKYITLSNNMVLFILTLGLTAAWLSSQQEDYQDRLARYSYILTLLSASTSLDTTSDGTKKLDNEDACSWFVENCNSGDTLTGFTLYKNVKNTWVDNLPDFEFIALDLPFKPSDVFGKRLDEIFSKDRHNFIQRVVYVRFRNNNWGWPAILVKFSDSPHWTIIESSWTNLWFVKTTWGRSLQGPHVDFH